MLFDHDVGEHADVDDVHFHGHPGTFGIAGFDELNDLPVILKRVGAAFLEMVTSV